MSLPSKAVTANFAFQDAGSGVTSYQLDITNASLRWEPVYWNERNDLSIGGVKRKKNIIRGYDAILTFDWGDVRSQESDIVDFLNYLKTATDNDYDLRFSVLGDSNFLFIIPTDGISYSQDYSNQVTRRTPVSMEFEVDSLRSSIDYDGTTP